MSRQHDGQHDEDQRVRLPAEIRQEREGAGDERRQAEPDEDVPRCQDFDPEQDDAGDQPVPRPELAAEVGEHQVLPVVGTRPERRASRASRASAENVSRAISPMPASEPISEDASTGSISTFWLGAEASASIAVV